MRKSDVSTGANTLAAEGRHVTTLQNSTSQTTPRDGGVYCQIWEILAGHDKIAVFVEGMLWCSDRHRDWMDFLALRARSTDGSH